MGQRKHDRTENRLRNESTSPSGMRLIQFILAICVLSMALVCMAGCSGQQGARPEGGQAAEPSAPETVVIKQSPDKYTWYVKSYVGANLANVGYVSMANDLRDRYGASNVKLVPVAVDGTYIDVSDPEALKGYVVIGQNLKPNTEIKLIFEVDDNGEEYDNLVRSSNIDSIVLLVKEVGGADEPAFDIPMTEISTCPGPETRYVQDYVGRNLAAVGYISMANDLRDYYGEGNIKLVPVADDGSFVDVSDPEALKQYRVVSQNVAPNTEITFTFDPEYIHLVESQSLEEIELRVTKIEQ